MPAFSRRITWVCKDTDKITVCDTLCETSGECENIFHIPLVATSDPNGPIVAYMAHGSLDTSLVAILKRTLEQNSFVFITSGIPATNEITAYDENASLTIPTSYADILSPWGLERKFD